MPKIQTYNVYTILAAGATKTYSATENIDVYEINADGGAVTLLADMIFSYSGTPKVGTEFKFQYGGGVTSNSSGGITVSFFGTNLTDEQALSQLVITAYWNGSSWEINIVKNPNNNVTSVTTFGSTPNSAGLSITGGVLNMQPADATNGGGVSITTQTFAGAKTFSILSGNFSIDSNGIGIGVAASARTYINSIKTFTNPITTVVNDTFLSAVSVFTYSGANTEPVSGSLGGAFTAKVTGAYTPKTITGLIGSINSEMTADLEKSFGVRGQMQYGASGGNTVSNFHANFVSVTYSNKTSNVATTTIDENYEYFASLPFQNNNTAGATPTLFTITEQFGFYCEDYTITSQTPIVYGSGAGTKVTATLTNSWQLYMAGTNATTTGSYIGNRLGVGFSTAPTTNSQITALLHIGAGVTSSAQIRLVAGVAPTSPNNGDIWFDGTDIKMRIGGVTKVFTLV